ncbi:lasso peptide isopeptide bond-forming cyclase [soil metagenome]
MGDYLLVSHARGPLPAFRSKALKVRAAEAGMTVSALSDRVWLAVCGPGAPGVVTVGAWRLIGDVHNRERRPLDASTNAEPWSYERKLVARFWGRFVGVLIGGDGDPKALLRDPCGGLDCLAWEDEGLVFAASFIPDWLALPASWRIDEERVAQALHDPLLVWDNLLIDGPVAVRPGTVQPLPLETPPSEIWNPAAVARQGLTHPMTDKKAVLALEQAVDDVVRSLAGTAGPLAAEVSGGLDSSLVAASLVRVRDDVAPWINLHGAEAQSDERAYVAALADRLGFRPLYAEHATGPLTAEGFADISTGIRPGLGGLDVHHDRDWASRFRAASATAVMTGRGGDSLLVQGATADVFADLWAAQGWRALCSPLLPGLAKLNDQSIWTLMARARRPRAGRPPRSNPLFRPVDHPVPSWLQDCEDLGPAKTQQIAGLIDGVGRQSPSLQSQAVTILTPLLSLPVVELCLSLPTAQLVLGARERGLAREAFRARLPPAIIDRRTKGEMSAIYGRMVASNLAVLRPFLLEGRLAAAGLIDPVALDAALTHEALIWQGHYGEIMVAAAIEAWVRHWEVRLRPPP